MNKQCRYCPCMEMVLRWQQFTNGTRHIRATCSGCGVFAGYVPQTPAVVAEANENNAPPPPTPSLFDK